MLRRWLVVSLIVLLAAAVQAAAVPLVATGAPSPLGLPFSSFGSVAVLGDGRVTFVGSSNGAFRRGNGLQHVIAAGDILPDGRIVAGMSAPAAGPEGCVAVRAFLVGGGSRVLRRCNGPAEVLLATGEALPDGRSISELSGGVAYGAGGQVASTALLDDGTTGLVLTANGTSSILVRTGAAAPSGGVFTALRLIGVTRDGRIGFRGSVASGNDGLFVAGPLGVRAIVQSGDASPVGGTFGVPGGASINDQGNWAFRSSVIPGNRAGLFRADTTGPVPIVEGVIFEGDQVTEPTITVRSLPSSSIPALNAAGALAFRATLSGGDGGSAIFVARPGERPERIVGSRDQTVGGQLVRLRDPAIGTDGSLVIPASVSGRGPALFIHRAGSLTELTRVGERTDIDAGQERFRFAQPSVRGPAEDAVFAGSREGIFVAGQDGAMEMLAFVGGQTPLGGTFTGFDPPSANAAGAVAFGVEIQDSNRASRAILATTRRGLRVVARGGQRVQGGKLVDFFVGTLDPLTRPDVGPRGEVAFEGALQGGRVPRALLLQRSGRPQPVVRAGRAAPGGGDFDGLGTPALLRNGMAFVAQVGETQRPKLFLRRGSTTRIVAAQGAPLPPGRLEGRFDGFDPPDANDSSIAFRSTLQQSGREGVFLASPTRVGLLVGTNDPAPGGGVFRGFSPPALGRTRAFFLGRLIADTMPPALYAVAAASVPEDASTPPAITPVLAPGDPSPLGGTIAEVGDFSANTRDALAVVVGLAGADAYSALLLLPST